MYVHGDKPVAVLELPDGDEQFASAVPYAVPRVDLSGVESGRSLVWKVGYGKGEDVNDVRQAEISSERRMHQLKREQNVYYIGMGVSGGYQTLQRSEVSSRIRTQVSAGMPRRWMWRAHG